MERAEEMLQTRRASALAEAERLRAEETRRRNPREASKDALWENSLGMKFVPVPGTSVLFCLWETRVQDYRAYAELKSAVNAKWEDSGFSQEDRHPVVNVGWTDANGFCRWLTEKEKAEGLFGADCEYRLPTDSEWSQAVGLPKEPGLTPKERNGIIKDQYPWGSVWPPPKGAGNYPAWRCRERGIVNRVWPPTEAVANYPACRQGEGGIVNRVWPPTKAARTYRKELKVDDFSHTAPVGSFSANRFGLYDLGGNVWNGARIVTMAMEKIAFCAGRRGALKIPVLCSHRVASATSRRIVTTISVSGWCWTWMLPSTQSR